jgi:hypothetical protein
VIKSVGVQDPQWARHNFVYIILAVKC